nr:rhodanese-related sulfurtransferase [Arthrobacter pigmenti]
MNRIVLYYAFTPLPDPEAIRLWQRALCEKLGLRGRILISKDGINGTVGGELNAVKQYVKTTREYPAFRKLDVKWSGGGAEDFPRLSIKVREEIVSFGAPGELKVDENGVVGGGKHLRPEQLHDLVGERGDDVVFFDGRNALEAQIGRFRNAIVPDVSTTHDFVSELDSGKYDHLKDKPVVTYCTGGIRCEVLSSLMVNRGFNEVYQLQGGIVRYGETYGDAGLWEGSLYVFDKRMHVEFSKDARTIGKCVRCKAPTNKFENCSNQSCRNLTLYCAECAADPSTLRCPQGCEADESDASSVGAV